MNKSKLAKSLIEPPRHPMLREPVIVICTTMGGDTCCLLRPCLAGKTLYGFHVQCSHRMTRVVKLPRSLSRCERCARSKQPSCSVAYVTRSMANSSHSTVSADIHAGVSLSEPLLEQWTLILCRVNGAPVVFFFFFLSRAFHTTGTHYY